MMKKNNPKSNRSGGKDDYDFRPGKKVSGAKDKVSKKRLSVYEDYDDEDDDYSFREKFKKRVK